MSEPKTILLIEDDADDRYFFTDALSEMHSTATYNIAVNGKEALEWLKTSVTLPDLIFTDINMPVMGGIECLTAIRNNPRTQNIPVVILSSASEQAEPARQLGAKAFIKKQGSSKLFQRQLEQMINFDFITDSAVALQTFKPVLSAH